MLDFEVVFIGSKLAHDLDFEIRDMVDLPFAAVAPDPKRFRLIRPYIPEWKKIGTPSRRDSRARKSRE